MAEPSTNVRTHEPGTVRGCPLCDEIAPEDSKPSTGGSCRFCGVGDVSDERRRCAVCAT